MIKIIKFLIAFLNNYHLLGNVFSTYIQIYFMNLSTLLIRSRKAKRMSQEEVAFQLNISQSTYHNWETGNYTPNTKYLAKILEVFELDIKDILNTA